MTNPGRNDPCPCGSGKKYKKCCLAMVEDADLTFRRLRQTHAAVIPRLTDFALEALGPDLFHEAWLEFNDHQTDEPFDPESPMVVLFMPWLLFNWMAEFKSPGPTKPVETTLAEMFLRTEGLTSDEQALLRTSIRCPYTFCEVLEVTPGVGLVLLDLLRQLNYQVTERTSSQTLKRGEIVYCATSETWGMKSNVGAGPYVLRPTAKREVLDLRKWIIEQSGNSEITSVDLHDFEYDIRGLYLNLVAQMLSPPRLANTDGDPMVPQKLYFDIESPDEAFHALKTLAVGKKSADLMTQATVKNGAVVQAEIEWLGGKAEAKKRLGGSVLLGLLKIDERLVVEVNSHERAKRIRRLIEKRLGSGVTYKATMIEPIESELQEAWQSMLAGHSASAAGAGFETGSFPTSIDEPPEVRAVTEEMARQHWESWVDLPVPALNHLTPREAAKTEEGRELLESLLLLYAIHDEESPDNYLKADIPALRRELGID